MAQRLQRRQLMAKVRWRCANGQLQSVGGDVTPPSAAPLPYREERGDRGAPLLPETHAPNSSKERPRSRKQLQLLTKPNASLPQAESSKASLSTNVTAAPPETSFDKVHFQLEKQLH